MKRRLSRKSAPADSVAGDTLSLGDLTHDAANLRKHGPRNVGMIVDALQEVGAARSIVIDEDGVIMCGNATADAAAQAGIDRVRVVDATGDELIAVRRRGLTGQQKLRLALLDNRSAELAEWDTEQLAALDAKDLEGAFTDNELRALLGTGGADLDDDENLAGGGGVSGYKEQYGVIVICSGEEEQREVFERLSAEGLKCRIVVT